VKIHCKYDELLPLKEVAKLLNPKNRNKHPPDQVDAIVQQFEYQGIRHPIIISNRSGLVAAGEGRYLAAKQVGMKTFPVSRQDFEDEEQEYAFGVADNAIALRAQLDLAGINQDIVNLGPDFDLSLLGLKDFALDPPNFEPGSEEDQGQLDQKKIVIMECPHCKEHFEQSQAKIIA
jgi:hypothetical protein